MYKVQFSPNAVHNLYDAWYCIELYQDILYRIQNYYQQVAYNDSVNNWSSY